MIGTDLPRSIGAQGLEEEANDDRQVLELRRVQRVHHLLVDALH